MLFLNSVRVAPGARSALAVACGLALSGWAVAQDVDEVEPIVITASRMPQLLQTAPIGASVITSEQIRRSGVADVNEAIRKLGGVASKSDLSNGRENSLDLRGFGSTADQNLVVLVNGLRVSENELASARLTAIPLNMVDRIEIVRGGASVLWGEGASAGAVNIVLKQASGDISRGSLLAAVGTFGGRDLKAEGQWGLGDAMLDASILRNRSDGFRENSAYGQDVASAGLQWSGAVWRAAIRFQQEDQSARLPGYTTVDDYAANRRSIQPWSTNDYVDVHETRYLANVGAKMGVWATQLDMGLRTRRVSFLSYAPPVAESTRTQSQVTPRLLFSDVMSGTEVKAVFGLDWQGWNFDQTGNVGPETGMQENRAAFGQIELNLPTSTRLSLGGREERVRKLGNFLGDGYPQGRDAVNYARYDKLHAGELGINQTLVKGLDVYGRMSSSFRLPNVDENRVTPGNGSLRPQQNQDRELGVKWSEGRNALQVRLFAQKTLNEIVYLGGAIRRNVNLDPTERRGSEVEGTWSPIKPVVLSMTWQQLTARFRSGANAGRDLVLVAPHTATARASYSIDDRNTVDFGMQFMASQRPGADTSNQCATRVPSSTLLDGRYAWSDRVWTLAISGTNLADKKGYNYDYSCDGTGIYPYAGRMVKFSVSRQF